MKDGVLYSFFATIVRPKYQVVALLITSLITVYILHRALILYRPLEKMTQLLPITPQKIKEWGGDPTEVQVGLFITNWHEFDVRDNRFIFDGVLWFQFDPALIALDTIEKFSFEKGDILKKSKPDTKLINGKLFAEYEIRLRFTTNLIYQMFPLDDHRVYIAMLNTYVSPSEVIFKVNKSGFSISESVFIPDWYQMDHEVKSGYEEKDIDKRDSRKTILNPKVMFMMDFRRSGVSLIMLILLPIFLIFFIGLFSFSFDPSVAQMPIVIIATTALTSLVAYRFVIQGMSPKVGYFLLSDLFFTLFLALAFMVFIIGVSMVKSGKLQHILVIVRGIMFLLFHLVFIILWYYLLMYWI
jgi:hypothetical protein